MLIIAIVLSLWCSCTSAQRSPEEWKSRRIYQIVTDRFAPSGVNPNPYCACCNVYCGGTFQGITDHLPYIQGMGFNAIWISPIPVNYDQGYHGYWATDFTKVNPHFGTVNDLQTLVNTAHSMGIWVMVGIVLNHVGPVGVDFQQITPFNDPSQYHDRCQVTAYQCESSMVLNCRLDDLPDLNQTVPSVRQGLQTYVNWLLKTFQFDGIRADTVMYIENEFWEGITQSINNTYIVGEVWSDVSCNQLYAQKGVSATLNYELYYAFRNVFQQRQSMIQLGQVWRDVLNYPRPYAEANFVENHDNDRFLNATPSNIAGYKSALTHNMFTTGIPIVYYGTEHLFSGGISDNYCRQPLWPTKFDNTTDMYAFLARLSLLHEHLASQSQYDVSEVWQDNSMYCFTRGKNVLVCTTNQPSSSQTRTIPNLPFTTSQQVCDWLNPRAVCQQGRSTMSISIPQGGMPLILVASAK